MDLVPAARAVLRGLPLSARSAYWEHVIQPYFAWMPYQFDSATTLFGGRLSGTTEDIIQRYVYYFGVWEPNLTSFISRRLGEGDTFIDVGANIGYFTIQASRLVGRSGMVIAVEASPKTFRLLERHVALNECRNVRLVQMAASDTVGLLRLYHGPRHNEGTTSLLESGEDGLEFEAEVPSRPLPQILTEGEWRAARLMKIDVEGAEAMIAESLLPLLPEARRDLEIVMEVSPRRLGPGGQCAEQILGSFRDAGFNTYRLENDYEASAYLQPRQPLRPRRFVGTLREQTDVVFSRIDAEEL
jgi:FkbM family methyltransferase